jgi:hypothetical protein
MSIQPGQACWNAYDPQNATIYAQPPDHIVDLMQSLRYESGDRTPK